MLRYTIIGDTVVDPNGEWVPWERVEYQTGELKAENAALGAEYKRLKKAAQRVVTLISKEDVLERDLDGAFSALKSALAGKEK